MTSESTAALGRRWFEEVWNARREEVIDELMTAESVGHIEGGEAVGPEGFRAMRAAFLSALPDVTIEVEDVICDGDRGAIRWRARGTHTGEGLGLAPTNRPIDVRGTSWVRVENGKIAEGWDTWNLGGMIESLRA